MEESRRLQVGSIEGMFVASDGVGITEENLARVFQHGSTTRVDGHGFGLHASALAARDLGGSLKAQSDGPGQGATFTENGAGGENYLSALQHAGIEREPL